MPCSTLSLGICTPPPELITKSNKKASNIQFYQTNFPTQYRRNNLRCSSSGSCSTSSWIARGFDLYELLGVESSSDQSEIKKAYRSLQKRCHPDIAGPEGHDMAIILNEVYSLLSDPNSRSAYDQEQAKQSEFKGYTGKPLYSAWLGSASEQRAVFVDEVKCVGCLKCALFASGTFAIESVYGRARVIAQWADPEDKIINAIQTCPVDCISIVERSDLAALEFLMSKQPRGNVRMTAGNTGGIRVSNIFADVSKFQRRFHEMKDKVSRKDSKESDFQREARISAVQGIRAISNWWYWQTPTSATTSADTNLKLTHVPRKTTNPNTEKLREAAARLKSRGNAESTSSSSMRYEYKEDYWTPMLTLPSPSNNSISMNIPSSQPPQTAAAVENLQNEASSAAVSDKIKWNPMSLGIPLAMAVVSAAIVGTSSREMAGAGINEHVAGTAVLEAVNSFELQVMLAGITWFVIGLVVTGIFEGLGNKGGFRR